MIKLLVDRGAQINGVPSRGEFSSETTFYTYDTYAHDTVNQLTPLATVLMSRYHWNKGDSGYEEFRKYVPLTYQDQQRRTQILEYLISLGASVYKGHPSGLSPLAIACARLDADSVRVLLRHAPRGVDVNRAVTRGLSGPGYDTTLKGKCPIHLLFENPFPTIFHEADDAPTDIRVTIMKLLKPFGLKFTRRDGEGNMAFASAALSVKNGRIKGYRRSEYVGFTTNEMKYLQKNGTDINAKNKKWDTALHIAVQTIEWGGSWGAGSFGRVLVRLLIDCGASVLIENRRKQTVERYGERLRGLSLFKNLIMKAAQTERRAAARVEIGRRLDRNSLQRVLYLAGLTDVNATTRNPNATTNLRKKNQNDNKPYVRKYIENRSSKRRPSTGSTNPKRRRTS